MAGVPWLLVAVAAIGPRAAGAAAPAAAAPVLSGGCEAVWEGNGGQGAMPCWVDRAGNPADRIVVRYETRGGTAIPGVDYVRSEGMLTFEPGAMHVTAEVPILGDADPEATDTLTLHLEATPLAAIGSMTTGYIVNDDPLPVGGDLSHGFVYRGDLASATDRKVAFFRAWLQHPSSYEVIVDEVSGDALPLELEIPGAIPPRQGEPIGAGTARSLRFDSAPFAVPPYLPVTVQSGGCSTDCGPDDAFRLRAYETTLAGGRINNRNGMRTVLVLQNPGAGEVAGRVHFWTETGGYAAFLEFHIVPRGSVVVDTAGLMPDDAGSVTVTHDAPYGVLQGKAMSFDAATGFSSDSLLASKPR